MENTVECSQKEAAFLAATSGCLGETPKGEQNGGKFWKREKGNARSVVSIGIERLIRTDLR